MLCSPSPQVSPPIAVSLCHLSLRFDFRCVVHRHPCLPWMLLCQAFEKTASSSDPAADVGSGVVPAGGVSAGTGAGAGAGAVSPPRGVVSPSSAAGAAVTPAFYPTVHAPTTIAEFEEQVLSRLSLLLQCLSSRECSPTPATTLLEVAVAARHTVETRLRLFSSVPLAWSVDNVRSRGLGRGSIHLHTVSHVVMTIPSLSCAHTRSVFGCDAHCRLSRSHYTSATYRRPRVRE
jgi:hypothetical protein